MRACPLLVIFNRRTKEIYYDLNGKLYHAPWEGIEAVAYEYRNMNQYTGSMVQGNLEIILYRFGDPEDRIDILGDFDPDVAWNGPVTVMINRLSASASEIFAGAIQDYNRGLIVGSRSFGKGTVQVIEPIDHGQIKFTHSKFYRISGESTQDKGVVPDIALPTLYDESEIGESALDSALPWDKVRPVRYGHFPSFDSMLPELEKRHQTRISDNPDFNFMEEQIAHLKEKKSSTRVTLNEGKLKQERDKAENWLLSAENRRRAAKGEAPVASLTELDEELPKDDQGMPINQEAEAILEEGAAITLDMIDLSERIATAQTPPLLKRAE